MEYLSTAPVIFSMVRIGIGLSPAEEPGQAAKDPNRAMGLPLFVQSGLQFLNALVGMTQARCVKGLIVIERLHLIWSDLWMA